LKYVRICSKTLTILEIESGLGSALAAPADVRRNQDASYFNDRRYIFTSYKFVSLEKGRTEMKVPRLQ
jgi:hypothetical protein